MKERIKQLRKHFGLSQAEFAQRINKSPGLISVVEGGKCNISDNTLREICDSFGVRKEWLVNGKGNMFQRGKEKNVVDREGIGLRVREVRKDMGMTQDQFATFVGCSIMQIHFVEVSKVIPTNGFLRKLATTCKVRYEWLTTGKGKKAVSGEELVDDRLIEWLKAHPEVVEELRGRSGLL